MIEKIEKLLGEEAKSLLDYTCGGIGKDQLHPPGPDFVERVLVPSDRHIGVLRNLRAMFNTGRLAGTGYLSILPVDQGIEHSGASAFAPNPEYFDPERIVELAIEGGCNAVASTLGVLGAVARRYTHRIPFIVKLNHNELLSYPNSDDQTLFASVERAFNMGAAGVGATIYFGSLESRRQLIEIAKLFERAHELGLFTVLWCYLRNQAFKTDKDYELSADLTGQANHLGVTIEADIVKQKQPECNGGYKALKFGKTDDRVYTELAPNHPIDWTRWGGGKLLHGPHGFDQLGRGLGRKGRSGAGRAHRRDQ